MQNVKYYDAQGEVTREIALLIEIRDLLKKIVEQMPASE
jgi:hypothetical protein